MSVIYCLDRRSGITYAYECYNYWDKELKKHRSKRKLIGRYNPETGEITKTDGRCLRNSPYQTQELDERGKIMERLRGMKISELKEEIVRLEMRVKELEGEKGSPDGQDTQEG